MIDKVESSTSTSTTSSIVAAAESEGEGSEAKAKKLFNYGFLNFLKTGEFHHNNQVSMPLLLLLSLPYVYYAIVVFYSFLSYIYIYCSYP